MTIDQARVTGLFDLWASQNEYPHYENEEYLAVLQDSARITGGSQRILDVGCGPGFVSSMIKSFGNEVVGHDISKLALQEAQKEGRIDDIVVADIARDPLPKESFDVIVAWGVLCVVMERREAFENIYQSLRPGGELFIFDHHRPNPYTRMHFARPDWVDRLIDRSNIPRSALDQKIVQEMLPGKFDWAEANYYSMFTTHPKFLINTAHDIARLCFRGIRTVTQAPWTGNMFSISGTKN